MSAGMDTSVDPCQDFYKFMCGRHERTKPPGFSWFTLAERRASKRLVHSLRHTDQARLPVSLHKARQYAQDVYATCVNVTLDEQLPDIADMYDQLGASPLLAQQPPFNPFQAMLRLQKYTGSQMVGDELMVLSQILAPSR